MTLWTLFDHIKTCEVDGCRPASLVWFDEEENGQHFWNTIFHKCSKRKRVNAWIMCFCIHKAGTPVVSAGATSQKVGSWVLIYCQEGGIFPSQAPINWLAFDCWKTWGRSFSWHVIWLKGELFIGNMDWATDPLCLGVRCCSVTADTSVTTLNNSTSWRRLTSPRCL